MADHSRGMTTFYMPHKLCGVMSWPGVLEAPVRRAELFPPRYSPFCGRLAVWRLNLKV